MSRDVPATRQDFLNPVLYDAPFGIFQGFDFAGADGPLLETLLPKAWVIVFSEKHSENKPVVVFDHKTEADGCVRAILSGRFEVLHTVLDESHRICLDEPGTALSDVEFFFEGVPQEEVPRGAAGHNFSTVVCEEPGEVLEFDPTPLRDDPRFLRNLGRQVSRKLLSRNADADRRFLKESKRAAHSLRQIIINRQAEENTTQSRNVRQLYLAGVTFAEVARDAGVDEETVRVFAKRLRGLDGEFVWDKRVIEMSRVVQTQVISKKGVAYLCQRAQASFTNPARAS